ncbi:peptidoglycan bridge formation glycyltransferase FemA/FemB family protein [Anaerolineales bacterium HSG6]|nr:peptidoglycan bridge formation glycyltransferase FemA/FemB family protein [Anaerolineales bacterium HSG6]
MTPHLLQTQAWADLKSQFGWTTQFLQTERASAQLLFRRLPLGLTIAYVPKGPTVDWSDLTARQAILTQIHLTAKQNRAIFLKLEPDVWQNESDESNEVVTLLTKSGFVPSDSIQPPGTAIVDISLPEDKILAAMKQKTRYNIRLSGRKGVIVRHGSTDDLPLFQQLSKQTAERDDFGIHSLTYYQTAYNLFAPDHCALLIAEFEGQPLAALMAFRQGQTAYYLYGASSNQKRNLMPAYLIQWEAIRWGKQHGCTAYDLWGIPNADATTLEAEFKQRYDGLWGVYRFKRGFGGQVRQSIGAFDYVYRPYLYRLYRLARRYR